MPTIDLEPGTLEYHDEGHGPVLVFLHGALMDGTVWDPVVRRLRDSFRCIVPTLPLGSHRLPVKPHADLSLAGYGRLANELVERLGLTDVTLIGNDHAAVLAAAVDPSPRVSRLVISSCEAFENYPPGLPGNNLRLTAMAPGGLRVAAALLLRVPALRRLPVTLGWLTKKPLPDDLVEGWLTALRANRLVRRDLRSYAAGARRQHMRAVCDRLGGIEIPTLVIWTPEDRIQRPAHGQRLARAIPNAQLAEIADSYTLVMRDQPDRFAELVRAFLASAPGQDEQGE